MGSADVVKATSARLEPKVAGVIGGGVHLAY